MSQAGLVTMLEGAHRVAAAVHAEQVDVQHCAEPAASSPEHTEIPPSNGARGFLILRARIARLGQASVSRAMGAQRETGEIARLASFVGALAVSDLVKSTLGPKGMDKILQSMVRRSVAPAGWPPQPAFT